MQENNNSVLNTIEPTQTPLLDKQNRRFLTPKEIAAYVLTSYGTKNLNSYVDTWKQYFLLNYTGISGAGIATMNAVTSIWDALDDPLSGIIIDRCRTRWGRLRPFLILPMPIWAICTMLFFLVPYAIPMQYRTIYAVAISVLNSIGWSYYNAWTILLYNITPNLNERNNLITIQKFVDLFGVWIPSMVPITVDFLPGLTGWSQEGIYGGFAFFFVGILVLCSIFAFKNIKERVPIASKEDMENVSILKSIKYTLSNRPLFVKILSTFFSSVKGIGGANESLFWANNTGRLTNGTICGLFTGIPNYIITPLAPKLIKRFGVRTCAICAGLFGGTAYTTLYLIGYKPFGGGFTIPNFAFVIVMLTICGLPNCLMGVCDPVIQGDVYDYLEWKSGVRNEGLVNAVSGYVTKLSGTLIGALSGLVLEFIHYEPIKDIAGNLVPQTDPSVLQGIWAIFCLAPAIARFGYGFSMIFFNVHGKFRNNMLEELNAKRSAKTLEIAAKSENN